VAPKTKIRVIARTLKEGKSSRRMVLLEQKDFIVGSLSACPDVYCASDPGGPVAAPTIRRWILFRLIENQFSASRIHWFDGSAGKAPCEATPTARIGGLS
jgi:hypothetical protein